MEGIGRYTWVSSVDISRFNVGLPPRYDIFFDANPSQVSIGPRMYIQEQHCVPQADLSLKRSTFLLSNSRLGQIPVTQPTSPARAELASAETTIRVPPASTQTYSNSHKHKNRANVPMFEEIGIALRLAGGTLIIVSMLATRPWQVRSVERQGVC